MSVEDISSWQSQYGFLRAKWDYDWEPSSVPTSTAFWLNVQDDPRPYLVRYMLYEGGQPYDYVYGFDPKEDNLTSTEFGIYNDSLYVNQTPPYTAYVPTVTPLLKVSNCVSVCIDTIKFRLSNPEIDRGMVEIDAVDYVEINGCSFRLSNWTGLKITNVPRDPNDACCTRTGVKISNSAANRCAMSGMYLGNILRLALVLCDTDSNGWRGYYNENLIYDNGGLILAGVDFGTIVGHEATRNEARGIWVYGSKYVQIVNSSSTLNKFDGLTLSGNPAKIRLSGCTIEDNVAPTGAGFGGVLAAGVRNSASNQISIYDTDFEDNDVQYMLGVVTAPCGFSSESFPSCGSSSFSPARISLNGNNDSMIDVTLDLVSHSGAIWGRDTYHVSEEDSTDYFDALFKLDVTED